MKISTRVKFNEEDRNSIIERISSALYTKAIDEITKAAESDTGTFRVIISTEDRDRQGEVVMMDGWDLTFYNMNPVVLWAHDYWSQPVSLTTKISVEVINGKKCLVAEGKFAPTDEGQELRKLYDGGFLKTTSVGFIPKEWDQETGTITKQELLEWSWCPVPANPYAVALSFTEMKELGIGVHALARKAMELNFKTATIKDASIEKNDDELGDACQLDDGTPGVLAEDPKDPKGSLVCVPTEDKNAKKEREGQNDGDNDGDDDNSNEIVPEDDPYNMTPEVKTVMKALVKSMDIEHERHTKTMQKHTDELAAKMEEMDSEKSYEDSMDDYQTKMDAEHEEHAKCWKSIMKEHVESMGKALNENDNEDGKSMKNIESKSGAKLSRDTKEKMMSIHKSITEATDNLKALAEGVSGEDDAKDDKKPEKPEEGEDGDKSLKGPQNNGRSAKKINDINEFIYGREIVRTIRDAADKALATYNKRGKLNAHGKK